MRVIAADLLFLEVVGGGSQTQVADGGHQALLGELLVSQLGTHADDGRGLALAALGDGGEPLLYQGCAALLGLAALVVAPQEQRQGAEQRDAIEGLAQGHLRYPLAAFMSYAASCPQPQLACCSYALSSFTS
ncbi:hypothetical protein [Pseudomonas entomophila]|uniref:hypothetical protein n=1 Tax=Pseudomonas entomophila TaxID=312306 RepID=UPI0031F2E474